jgi:NRPS condensation-like uncharacterized protein
MGREIYTERADLFDPNIYIQFSIDIIGNPTKEQLILAVQKAFSANEATMSRIVIDPDGKAYYKRMDQSGCKVSVTNQDFIELILENEKVPFAIDQGELIRVFIMKKDSKTSLLIRAHHLVGDGKSVVYLIEDIMNCLSGKEVLYKPLSLYDVNTLPKECNLSPVYKIYANYFNKQWGKSGRCFLIDEYYSVHKKYWKDNRSVIITERFTAKELHQICLKAKEDKLSVNSLIAGAFLRADTEIKTVGLAVDGRINGNRSMSNQATGVKINIKNRKKRSTEDSAKLFQKQLHRKLSNPKKKYFILKFMPRLSKTLVDSVLMYANGLYTNPTTAKLAKAMGYVGENTKEVSISNLTRLDIPNHYGKYEIRNCLFIPPVISYARRVIGVASMEDGMMISYHFMSGNDDKKEINYFKRAIELLR